MTTTIFDRPFNPQTVERVPGGRDAAGHFHMMRIQTDVSVDELRAAFSYEPSTGVFTHLTGSKKGKTIGRVNDRGYVRASMFGKCRYLHRMAWLYVHGELPLGLINHRDGDRGNNRISNLMDCSDCQNAYNRQLNKNNTSGKKGVTWIDEIKKFRVDIKSDKKRRIIGNFVSFDDACKARDAAERESFGEFRRSI